MRPVLLGMNNPVSSRPEHALFPYPPNCTGWRVLEMLRSRVPTVTRSQYCAAFDRRNLLDAKVWKTDDAREAAQHFLDLDVPKLIGRTVLVFGAQPRRLLGLPELLLHPQTMHGVTWRQLPHPSGRNRWYNDARHKAAAAMLLEELYVMSTGETHAKPTRRSHSASAHENRARRKREVHGDRQSHRQDRGERRAGR
jgi:hypothetical protein